MRVQGQSQGTGDGDAAADGLRAQAATGARDGVGAQPAGVPAQPSAPKRSASPAPVKAVRAPDAVPAADVRDAGTAPDSGELTGPLPVVAPTGRRNGRTRARQPAPADIATNPLRRTRVIVRRLGPLSVFRFTLLYSFAVMLVIYLAIAILYTVLGALGVLDNVAKTFVSFGVVNKGFVFDGGWIFSRLFIVGVVLVLLWSVLKVIASLVYNLVSNIVGGIEVTLAERR